MSARGREVRVLVVEDDAAIADAVLYALRKEGMQVDVASSLEAARPLLGRCDVVVLDLVLTDGSGFSLLREAQREAVPPRVVVLTSRDEEVDCVAALEAGADDYVTKPFSPRALVARIRAILRRGGDGRAPASAGQRRGSRRAGCASTAPRGARVTARPTSRSPRSSSTSSRCSPRRPGACRRGSSSSRRSGGASYALTPRTVDSHFKGLRRKLEGAGAPEGLIETIRAVGFRLRDAP